MKKTILAGIVVTTAFTAISACSNTGGAPSNSIGPNLSIQYQYQLPQNDIFNPLHEQSDIFVVKDGRNSINSTRTISGMDLAVKCSKVVINGMESNSDCVHTLVLPRLSIDAVKRSGDVWVVGGTFSNEMGRSLTLKTPDGKMIVHTQSIASEVPLWVEGTTTQRFQLTTADTQPLVITGPTNNRVVLSLKSN